MVKEINNQSSVAETNQRILVKVQNKGFIEELS